MTFDQGVDAIQSAAGGLAADAGIDHLMREFFRRQALLQQTDPAVGMRYPVTGGEAITEHQYFLRAPNGLGVPNPCN